MARRSGILTVHPDGYGFVLADQPGMPDVFIPSRAIRPALHTDRVEVECRKDARGRWEGRVVSILSRGLTQLVGRIERVGRTVQVVPDDPRIGQRVGIPGGAEGGARSGDTVVVRILSYPDGGQRFTGKVERVLGDRGELTTEVEVVIARHILPTAFPPALLAAAERVHRRGIPAGEIANRRDLRGISLVTIDGETARDFDDAIAAAPAADGRIRIWVAIADVGFYVEPGSLLDKEALARGTSVYFPARCLPMFPPTLSDDLCSLRPNEDRLAVVAEFIVDRSGTVSERQFYRAVIRSRARLTYTVVRRMIVDSDPAARRDHVSIFPTIEAAAEACRRLQSKRQARGSIDFDLPEPEIVLDMQGGPEAIVRSERNFAHQMIEELMIAANEAVAQYLARHKRPCVYRIHEPPSPDRMLEFGELCKHLGLAVRFTQPPRPGELAHIVAAVRGRPEERWINHHLLRSMAQAVYDTKNIGHFGLASKCYCHFTSPIRRYPDLMVHRLLVQGLEGEGHPPKLGSLQSMAEQCSRRERIAMEAEREMAKVYAAYFLRDRIGQIYAGVIAHVTKAGFYVELADYFVEGFVPIATMRSDRYCFDPQRLQFVGRRQGTTFAVGDRVRVRIEEVKVESREVRFVLDLS
ncbi:MAG: ribonuclease R [Deltaproteobacteria bacterium]|nr:ribonuclease R [Deltaproteobacteria bacterium]